MAHHFVTSRRVEFCDTDAAGIVHFSALFCYMEQAEHAMLRSLGTSVMAPMAGGGHLTWPRVRAECDFIGPIRFEDELEIHVQIARLGQKSVTYRFDFYSASGKLVARGSIVAVCCRIGTEPQHLDSIPIPESIRELLADFVTDENVTDSK